MTPQQTVFVVDDDSFMREMLGHVLGEAGIPVRVFVSAADLLAHADLRSPCLLLLDVRMPDMSGPELQARLRAEGFHVPIIFMTGFSDVPVAVNAMRDGALDFLIKPFDSATVIDLIRQAFTHEQAPWKPVNQLDYSRRLETLTPRERQVLDLMLTGMSSKHIARTLECSFRTIDIHRGRVMTKMAATSLAQLVRMNVELHGAT